MAKVREISWPDEYQDLKRIEEFMICGICYEYIDTSVMTPCSHNYCSVCIRKYLHYKTQCPACFHDFFEKDLYINRAMDGLIMHYLQIREKILSLIENKSIYNSVKQLKQVEQSNSPSTPPVRPARNSLNTKQTPKSIEETKNATESKILIETKQNESKVPTITFNSPVPVTSKSDLSSPTTSKSSKVQIPNIAKMFNTPKRKEVSTPVVPVANVKNVKCPVCTVDISEQHINVHLDACLKREISQKTAIKKQPKRAPLPKLVLHVMKETELRKKIKEYGLSTIGNRRTLINRFTRYSVIYNAECDKPDPRPIADLIRQCEMEERQERNMDSFLVAKNTENRLQINKYSGEDKIEEAQKNYREANKSSFDKLIEEVRNRRKMEKEKQQQENNEKTVISDKPSTSVDINSVENISENDKNISYVSSVERTIRDSDSEEECPLQLYRSDKTVKSITLNLDDSSSCDSASPSLVKKQQKSKHKINLKNEKSPSSKIESNNIYEMETDNSTDDEVLASPVVNKNQNRKRVKLSKTLLNESSVKQTIEDVHLKRDEDIIDEQDIQENPARKICNSIIEDFLIESEDSANEFIDKRNDKTVKQIDNSTNNEVLASPVVKKNQNRKRVKLTKTSLNESSVKQTIEDVNLNRDEDIIDEQDIQENPARKICNSIIEDFLIESEDSANEFIDKRNDKMVKQIDEEMIEKIQDKAEINLNQSKLPEVTFSSNQTEDEDKFSCDLVNNILNVSLCDIPLESLNEDKFKDFENTTITSTTTFVAQKTSDEENYFEKANNTDQGNASSQFLGNKNTISRPVRNRNPPQRFMDKTSTKKVKSHSEEDITNLNEDKCTDSQRSTLSERGSLKRRRGRSKVNSNEQQMDEVHNPPKRPVRRRQAASQQVSC